MENIKLGLLLMVVGMVTVFIILLIVIYGSQYLVKLINKIAPEEEKTVKAAAVTGTPVAVKSVLEAAVSQLTGGKGHITKITQL